jgi:hypothetical protein
LNLSFTAELTKAEEVDGKLYLAGVASTTDVDKHRERMSASALADMAKTAVGVPLTNSHANELDNQIGTVTEAVVEGDKLAIKAEVDAEDPAAVRLFKKVQKGFKAAFSVGGKITSDRPALEKGTQRVITGVVLDHIMLTAKPANGNTFAVALAKTFADLDAEDARKIDNTTGDNNMEIDLTKAGAKFSAESKASLKELHDAGNDDTKAKVRAMLGDDADAVLGAKAADSDPIGIAKAAADKKAADEKAAADKAAADKLAKDAADKAAADAAAGKNALTKEDVAKLVADELGKALKEIVVKAKGSNDTRPADVDFSKLSKSEMIAEYAKQVGLTK